MKVLGFVVEQKSVHVPKTVFQNHLKNQTKN